MIMEENLIFNEEQKERYLNFVTDNEDTKITIRRIFNKSWLFENGRNRDLCDFNLEEIGKVIKHSNPFNANVARSTTNFISSYVSYCIDNGLRENNINPLDGVSAEWIKSFVDETKKIHYSFDEFLDLVSQLENKQDKAFLFLMFEGILGASFSELTSLKFNDFDLVNKSVKVNGRRGDLKLSNDCIECVLGAFEETKYKRYIPKENRYNEKELAPSEFLFKNTQSPRTLEGKPVSQGVLYTRLHNIKEEFNKEYLTPNAIRQSGQIFMAAELFRRDGKLDKKQLHEIGEKYNVSKIQNQNTGKFYPNVSLMKDYINKNTLSELYNLDVEIGYRERNKK
jgi:integrase